MDGLYWILEHGDVFLSDILTSFLVIGVGFEHRRSENIIVIQIRILSLRRANIIFYCTSAEEVMFKSVSVCSPHPAIFILPVNIFVKFSGTNVWIFITKVKVYFSGWYLWDADEEDCSILIG